MASDAEKTFDRVHWGYLSETLAKFGLSGFIHSAIMALYTNPSAWTFTSGMLSVSFDLTDGTHKGADFLL